MIDKVKKGQQRASLSKECGTPESTLRRWRRDDEKLRLALSEIGKPDQEHKSFHSAKNNELDKTVLTWFTQASLEGMLLSRTNVLEQALKFHKMLHPDDNAFNGSQGWFQNF